MVPIIRTKRAYEPAAAADGRRILVDRVWPRGMAKGRLGADVWLKSIAPSAGLQKRFNHDPARWNEFKARYFLELDRNPDGVATLMDALKQGSVTLLLSAKDSDHNQAVALKEYLAARIKTRRTPPASI